MLDAIEDTIMVKQIKESADKKPIEPDSLLNPNEPDTQGNASYCMFLQDNVSLSTTTEQLEALIATLKDIPEINSARVAYFKAEIAAGNYKMDNNKIAMKIFEDEVA